MAKKKKKGLKIGLLLFAVAFILCLAIVFQYYGKIYKSAVTLKSKTGFLYVHSDWNRSDLVNHLFSEGILKDTTSFVWVANQKEYKTVKPGKYELKSGMSNNSLVNLLRSGKQIPVQVTFNTIRKYRDLAGKIGAQIEADSASLYQLITDENTASKYGFNRKTFLTLFIPNTYELYWNTSAEEFVQRMAAEYKRFWNEDRIAKSRKLNLSQ